MECTFVWNKMHLAPHMSYVKATQNQPFVTAMSIKQELSVGDGNFGQCTPFTMAMVTLDNILP